MVSDVYRKRVRPKHRQRQDSRIYTSPKKKPAFQHVDYSCIGRNIQHLKIVIYNKNSCSGDAFSLILVKLMIESFKSETVQYGD
jgi:hypothetical protein